MLTEAAGGEFYDLAGPRSDLAFCPLRDVDDEADIAWAVGWIEVLCEFLRVERAAVCAEAQKRCGRRSHAAPDITGANTYGAIGERAG